MLTCCVLRLALFFCPDMAHAPPLVTKLIEARPCPSTALDCMAQSAPLSQLRLGPLMQVQPGMARELFPAGFVSCWAELDADGQDVGPPQACMLASAHCT